MAGLCQDCTGCCVVFEVKEVAKAFGERCKHLGPTLFGVGCQIYTDRPDACKRYVCLWLDSQRRSEVESMPEAMRPDVTKVVLGWPWGEDRETLFVYPYPGYDDAWRRPPVAQYLQSVLARGAKVVVKTGDTVIAIRGDSAFVGTEDEFANLAT
jgi:uncharacterized protein